MSSFVRIALLGDGGVGKTTFIRRAMGLGESDGATTKLEVYRLNVDGTDVVVYDFPGQKELFESISKLNFDVDVIIMFADASDMATFSNLTYWYSKMIDMGISHKPKFLVVNKMDIELVDPDIVISTLPTIMDPIAVFRTSLINMDQREVANLLGEIVRMANKYSNLVAKPY